MLNIADFCLVHGLRTKEYHPCRLKDFRMNMKIITVFSILLGLQSCKGQTDGIEAVIARVDNVDLSQLKDRTIYFRSRGYERGTSVYLVSSGYKVKCSPYAVDFDEDKKRIFQIRNNLVLGSCGEDYLTKEEITKYMGIYMRCKVNLLQVDTAGNVYINPGRAEKAILLRKAPHSTPIDLDEFSPYKGDWYIRK